MSKELLSPDQYITKSTFLYPSLYASQSYEESKFKVLDHSFNTIGNGITIETLKSAPLTEEETAECSKWFTCSSALYGYFRVEQFSGFAMPTGESIIVLPSEKHLHPTVVHWTPFECSPKNNPYPNFKKTYSMVWNLNGLDFEQLGPKWIDAAIWYYDRCLEYFNDPGACASYPYAFPNDDECENDRIIKLYASSMKNYSTVEEISKEYELEFIGDPNDESSIRDFVSRRWELERRRIIKFIIDTLERLHSMK